MPLSCEEHNNEKGLSGRHAVEEARSAALLRPCPKCKIQILKQGGCNKITCTTCRSIICDYCGKDISSERYAHFEPQGIPRTTPGEKDGAKCPLFDASSDRKEKQMFAAEENAKEIIRRNIPSISAEDLEIKFSNEVRDSNIGRGEDLGRQEPRHQPNLPHLPHFVRAGAERQVSRLNWPWAYHPGIEPNSIDQPAQALQEGSQAPGLQLRPFGLPPQAGLRHAKIARLAENEQRNDVRNNVHVRLREIEQLRSELLIRRRDAKVQDQRRLAMEQEPRALLTYPSILQANAQRVTSASFAAPMPAPMPVQAGVGLFHPQLHPLGSSGMRPAPLRHAIDPATSTPTNRTLTPRPPRKRSASILMRP